MGAAANGRVRPVVPTLRRKPNLASQAMAAHSSPLPRLREARDARLWSPPCFPRRICGAARSRGRNPQGRRGECPGSELRFRTTCRIPVTDSVGHIPLPFIATAGTAWLQSRSFTAEPGTPGAGKTGYLYRISMTEASGAAECIGGLVLDFGPVAKLPYQTGVMADVFVITTGGLGTIGIKSATKTGNVIEFELAQGLCLSGGADIKNTTFFFGLAADTAPTASTARIWAVGNPPFYEVEARVPAH